MSLMYMSPLGNSPSSFPSRVYTLGCRQYKTAEQTAQQQQQQPHSGVLVAATGGARRHHGGHSSGGSGGAASAGSQTMVKGRAVQQPTASHHT